MPASIPVVSKRAKPPKKTVVTKKSAVTRTTLLRAAERLFAERGVDAVSMREIAAAAGQANHSAALYHFRDKHELLDALLERHSGPIAAGWTMAVEHLVAQGNDSLEELVWLMARPLVAKLDDPDGGADYLLVVAQLVASRSFPLTSMPATTAPGILALSAAMMRHIAEIPPELVTLHMMRVAAVLYCSIANYHMLTTLGTPIPRDEFLADLVASLVAVIRATAGARAEAVV